MNAYKVKEFKQWNNEENKPIGSVVFEQRVEPVDWLLDFKPEVGVEYKGRIVDYTTRNGQTRERFELDVPSKQEAYIGASWAIQTALPYMADHQDLEALEQYADALLKLRDKLVKGILNEL